jgi:hypothetical protein
MKLGSPSQLTISQVETIKKENEGTPFFDKAITIGKDKLFKYNLAVHENDCFLIELIKQK